MFQFFGLDHNGGHNVVRTVPAVSGFSSTIREDAGANEFSKRDVSRFEMA